MRTFAVLGSVAALGLALAGLGTSAPAQTELIGKCAKANLDLYEAGKLTLATDNPAFPPWWGGNAGQGFETSNPYSGKGYESAVAYEVAKRLGFTKAEVTWKVVPFVKSYAPGKKTFDWYMAQVSYLPVRAKAVDFSNSYYFVNQAVVGIKGTPITKAKSIDALKPFTLGAAIGTTSYNYITSYIRPTEKPKVYDTNNDADHGAEEQADRRASSSTSPAPATSPRCRCRRRPSSAACPRRARGSASAWCSRRARHWTHASTVRWRRCVRTGRWPGSRRGGLPAARRC